MSSGPVSQEVLWDDDADGTEAELYMNFNSRVRFKSLIVVLPLTMLSLLLLVLSAMLSLSKRVTSRHS